MKRARRWLSVPLAEQRPLAEGLGGGDPLTEDGRKKLVVGRIAGRKVQLADVAERARQ